MKYSSRLINSGAFNINLIEAMTKNRNQLFDEVVEVYNENFHINPTNILVELFREIFLVKFYTNFQNVFEFSIVESTDLYEH